jgi:hypothetical protein
LGEGISSIGWGERKGRGIGKRITHEFTDKEEREMIAEINEFLNTGDIEVDPVLENRENQEADIQTPETSHKRSNRKLDEELTSVKKQKQDTASKPQQETRDRKQREIYEINEFFNSGEIEVDPVLEDREKQHVDLETEVQKGEYNVYARGIETEITKVNSLQVCFDIALTIDREPKITMVNKSLRIEYHSKAEMNRLLKIDLLAGHRVEMSEPYKKNGLYKNGKRGIIFHVEQDITIQEMELAFGVKVERIVKKKDGQTITTGQVILHFIDDLPMYVYFGYRRFRVSVYIPEPRRCYRCQKYWP